MTNEYRGLMAHTPAPGREHHITQVVTLVCPEARHTLGRVRGDTVQGSWASADNPSTGDPSLWLNEAGTLFEWVCWSCAAGGPGRHRGSLSANGVWHLLARMKVHGPAHVTVKATHKALSASAPAPINQTEDDATQVRNHRVKLSTTAPRGQARPTSWLDVEPSTAARLAQQVATKRRHDRIDAAVHGRCPDCRHPRHGDDPCTVPTCACPRGRHPAPQSDDWHLIGPADAS